MSRVGLYLLLAKFSSPYVLSLCAFVPVACEIFTLIYVLSLYEPVTVAHITPPYVQYTPTNTPVTCSHKRACTHRRTRMHAAALAHRRLSHSRSHHQSQSARTPTHSPTPPPAAHGLPHSCRCVGCPPPFPPTRQHAARTAAPSQAPGSGSVCVHRPNRAHSALCRPASNGPSSDSKFRHAFNGISINSRRRRGCCCRCYRYTCCVLGGGG